MRSELPPNVVALAQQGDRHAQSQVLERYAAVLSQFVRRLVGVGHDLEALTQSLLERLLTVLPKFDPAGRATLTTWVFTVAHHFIIDLLRRAQLKVVPLEAAHQVVDESSDPVTAIWRSEVRDALENAIAALPPDQRRVFVLVHLHEQPLEAVAEVEGVPLGTVKSRLFRAKARLAQALGPQFGAGGDDGQH